MRWTLLLCLCSATIAAQEPHMESLSILPDRTVVRFGEPFTLVVARTWETGAPMESLAPSMLNPIGVQLVNSKRETVGGWVRDVQTYRAHIFQTGSVRLPRIVLRVRENATGIMREVASTPWTFDVTSALDGDDPFVPENPPREALLRLATPASRVGWILLVGSALIGVFVWQTCRIWRNGEGPRISADASLSDRLERSIAASFESEGVGRSRVIDEVVGCLRDETARRTGTAIDSLTDAELESDARIREGLGAGELAELVDLLHRGSDWRYRPTSPRREDIELFARAARDWIESSRIHDDRQKVAS